MIKQIKSPGDFPVDARYAILVWMKVRWDEDEYDETGHLISAWTLKPAFQISTATDWDDVDAKLNELYSADPTRKDILVLENGRPLEIVARLNFVVRV